MGISNWQPTMRAACWMSGALVSLLAMAVATRELSAHVSVFQILFFRSACGLLIIVPLVWRAGWRQVATARPGLHVLRNATHFLAQYGWVYGIAFIPMAEVFAIEFTVPVWTALLAAVLLGERLTAARLLAVALGLAGVFVIVRPGSGMIHPAALAVLLGAIAFALAYIMTKMLARTETPLCILFYMTLVQLPLGLAPALANWSSPPPHVWPWILVVGTMGLATHYCLARAMALADATVVVPLDFLRLPLIAVVGAVFYGEAIEPLLFLGAGMILAGNLYSILAERRRPAMPRAARDGSH